MDVQLAEPCHKIHVLVWCQRLVRKNNDVPGVENFQDGSPGRIIDISAVHIENSGAVEAGQALVSQRGGTHRMSSGVHLRSYTAFRTDHSSIQETAGQLLCWRRPHRRAAV